jgi:hypothetical protein
MHFIVVRLFFLENENILNLKKTQKKNAVFAKICRQKVKSQLQMTIDL